MNSRGDHLEWMHRHFAHKVVTGSELLAEVEAEAETTSQERLMSPVLRRTTRPPGSRSSATPRSSSAR